MVRAAAASVSGLGLPSWRTIDVWAGLSIAWAPPSSLERESTVCKQTSFFGQLTKGNVTMFARPWVIFRFDFAHIAIALIFRLTMAVENLIAASAARAHIAALITPFPFASTALCRVTFPTTFSFAGLGIIVLTLALGLALTIGKLLCILANPVSLPLVPDTRHCVL